MNKLLIFSLDDYFLFTKKYYLFFDNLFRIKKENKKDILKELGIGGSSYRNDKLKPIVKNNTKSLLIKYFEYEEVNIDYKEKYEKCISKIYYTSYYKKVDELESLLEELETYINHNNYLKPLFVLFKVFGIINFNKRLSSMKKELKSELEYLSLFNNDYFMDKYKLIYLSILYYFNYKTDLVLLDNLSLKHKDVNWIAYNIRASYNYVKENDYEALIFYQKALDNYKASINIERTLITISNISYIYNNLKKYDISYDLTSSIIGYVCSSRNEKWIKDLALHYLYSLFQLGNYKEIMEFYNLLIFDIKMLKSVSAIICILASYYCNQYEKAEGIINEFKNDLNVKTICDYLDKKDSDILLNIESTPYLYEIVQKINRK